MKPNRITDAKRVSSITAYAKLLVSRRSECHFRMFGDEEKICSKCRYIIPVTDDDSKALEETIKSTTELPKCRQNGG